MFAATGHTQESLLNAEQEAAVQHTGSPLLVVAGAGTGKTKTLVSRVVRIIEDGADPSRILLLTFTRRSAAEMLGRVKGASTNRSAGQVWGGTFHSVANRLVRHFGAAAALPSGFTVLDHSDSVDLMGIVRNEHGFGERSKRFPRKETIAGIYSRMVNSQAKLADVLEQDYPWCFDNLEDLKAIFGDYMTLKRANQVLDFDDLLLFWRGLTVSPVGGAMRDLFDHILIDEYQDTNPIQADIISGMCRPDTDLCAVGDDAQAIYGFRSATVANMWDFEKRFPGATTVTLEQNYRSTMPILAAANAVLCQPISTTAGTKAPAHFAKALWSTKISGPEPQLVTCNEEGDQSRFVADAILAARERGVELRDQAVLFRVGHHSHALEFELTRRDIPFVKYGGLKHLETAHVKDLLSLLRILDNPQDQLAWHRVLGTLEHVGPATVRKIMAAIGVEDPESNALRKFIGGDVPVPAPAADQVAELRQALSDCSQEKPLRPSEQIDRLRPFCALVFPNRYENAAARLSDLEQLAASATQYETRSRFLTEVTLDPPGKTGDLAGPPHLDDDWLTLSTIHSAKGCEWRHVHLLHAADGNLPSEMALGNADGLAEELRLLYVAMTRAKEELVVTFPLRYHVNRFANDDRHVWAQLSRFLDPVRDRFTESSAGGYEEPSATLDLTSVGVADEVDALLTSLWD